MKKVILSAVFTMIAVFAIAQSSTKNVQAIEILKVTPEVYAQKVQAELQEVCLLKPAQAEEVLKIATTTAEKIHQEQIQKIIRVIRGLQNPGLKVALDFVGDRCVIRRHFRRPVSYHLTIPIEEVFVKIPARGGIIAKFLANSVK